MPLTSSQARTVMVAAEARASAIGVPVVVAVVDAGVQLKAFTRMDDSALLGWRAEARARLERLTPGSRVYVAQTVRYDRSTEEVNERARRAWARAN